jgi:hypothetical protein
MKNFSLPRLALVLWFFNYCLFSVFSYVLGTGRHGILDYIIYAAVWVVVELVCLGIIEDIA